ncbi:hypothetical protein C2S51_018204 [Perilla frutescens var. frutescens]|nr:hypothetical protein C2S51_018204 [Perilla frutescens var. frutescens]
MTIPVSIPIPLIETYEYKIKRRTSIFFHGGSLHRSYQQNFVWDTCHPPANLQLAHHQKQRTINNNFERSGETISRNFRWVINSIISIQGELLKKPEPIPDGCTDERWKWFKGCLGALDGTHIKVLVPKEDKLRYRTWIGEIATNVLGVCSQDMEFIYVLPGWEGSMADGRILRDAISRRNGLIVPRGSYYLVDDGYTNGE